jgi:2-C-methyl-D-erythritol 2,4-cyclodiphosphate synthase
MMRIGTGYDLHRLVPQRPLILGGIRIEHPLGLDGHSDADALCHAVIDALLGALARGDIGSHFPDTDPRYKDADSMQLLAAVVNDVREAGYYVCNLDSTIVAQRPKLRPYIESMRDSLAQCLGISPTLVSIKAKTNEGVGPEGREEAISTQVVVLLSSQEPVS